MKKEKFNHEEIISSMCSSKEVCTSCKTESKPAFDATNHWDKVYQRSTPEHLGWYESDVSKTLQLIHQTRLPKDAHIVLVGAGSTTLVDTLVHQEYSKITATDISQVALDNLSNRVGDSVDYLVDDLTNPVHMKDLAPIDLWIDRAVLHFFLGESERLTYFDTLKSQVKEGGFVLLAQFAVGGATHCSGLPIHPYDVARYSDYLGCDFEMVASFDYEYTMPSGKKRPYIYALYKKIG